MRKMMEQIGRPRDGGLDERMEQFDTWMSKYEALRTAGDAMAEALELVEHATLVVWGPRSAQNVARTKALAAWEAAKKRTP